ncbi:uncharacterized protein [Brachionichthys hirsutus]|uniref:uncharacterized protein n=1 Tax=Brachionichthys hirsutus TaxID=412623 RepID=UPI0036050A29
MFHMTHDALLPPPGQIELPFRGLLHTGSLASMDPRLLFAASVLLLMDITSITSTTSSEEVRASQCKVIWLFGILCPDVFVKLVNQIEAWQVGQRCPYEGQRCRYEVRKARLSYNKAGGTLRILYEEMFPQNPYLIKATHTDPTSRNVTDLQFVLEQKTVCEVTGEVAPELSNDPAGNSTFCSLQNLMDGSDLINAVGYKQISNKWICPGLVANCSFS